MKNKDGTNLSIPDHVKIIDVHVTGNLIEIVAIDPYMTWRSNTVASVADLESYLKEALGFEQTILGSQNKRRWIR